MNPIEITLLVIQIIVSAVLCGLILLQHGKGADMGAAFGSGSSGSVFGASGSANFLSRTTAILAAVFFATSLGLTYLGAQRTAPKDATQQGVMQNLPAPKTSDVPQSSMVPAPAAPAKNDVPTKSETPPVAPAKQGEAPK